MKPRTKCARKTAKPAAACKACEPAKAKETTAKPVPAREPAKAKAAAVKTEKPAPKAVKTQRVTFSIRADPNSKVFLAGSFNDWNPTAEPMTDEKGKGLFSVSLPLEPGDYQYKFVVDGTWRPDETNHEWVLNEHGTMNSVKHVEA